MAIGVKDRGQFKNIICLSDNDLHIRITYVIIKHRRNYRY
jgi:hypothetical protein